VDVTRDGSRLAINVRDRGLGIPPDEQRDIFQKFVRGAEAQSAGIRGTGIGLAMVEHIVRGHGGKVRVESIHGSGSTFTIVLPVST
jgi:signal transduction histidine kinase